MVTDAPILVAVLVVVGEESSVAPPRSRSRSLASLPRGSNSAQRILSPMLSVAIKPPIHQTLGFSIYRSWCKLQKDKGPSPGSLGAADLYCKHLVPNVTVQIWNSTFYKMVNPSHPIQTQPYRPNLEFDFALTRSKLVGMSMRDYQSHTSNLLHNI